MRTAAVAALIAFVVAATGFSLQAAGLRRTPQANAVAARAATLLLRYRFATSTFHVAGRTVRGHCLHGWFEGLNDRPARGTILVLDNGGTVRAADSHPLRAQGWARLLPMPTLELAGCTQVLGDQIAALAQFDDHIGLARTAVFGRPALAGRFARLSLLVAPTTDRPLGVAVAGVLSSIKLAPLNARHARALETRQ